MAYLRSRRYHGRRYRGYSLKRRRWLRRGRRLTPYLVPRPLGRRYATTFLRFSINETRAVGNNGAGWYTFGPGPYTLRAAWTGSYSTSGTAPTYLWDYYRIRAIRVEVWPAFRLFNLPASTGSCVIDLDQKIPETTSPLALDPFRDRSSRKSWNPARKFTRFYQPKPDLLNMTGSTTDSRFFQPNSLTRQFWLNSKDDLTNFFGPHFSIYSYATDTYRFNIKTVFYIQFKEFIAPPAVQVTEETGETENFEDFEI